MTTEKNYDVVIYHKGCNDGFASAYVANKVLGKKARYIPMSYFNKTPTLKKKKILICDFSFDEETTLKLIEDNEKVFIIDHHKTAQENLKNIDKKYKIFDMNHSGAYLTWKYFFPNKDPPVFIKLVEDYDLWKFKYTYTESFNLGVSILPYKFGDWANLEDKHYLTKIIKRGKIILTQQNNFISHEYKKHKIREETLDGKKYRIAYKNTNTLINELGNTLCKKTKCDFAVCYFYNDKDDTTKFSLRSIDEKTDVSVIAKLIGGGGHRNACGFTKKGFHNSIVPSLDENNENDHSN